MSADSQNDFEPVERKLRKFFACVVRKARRDAAFASELRRILEVGEQEDSGTQASNASSKHEAFDAVSFLHKHGAERLSQELAFKPDSELRAILKSEGIARGKEPKTIERENIISEIVQFAVRKLNQGSAFLGKR